MSIVPVVVRHAGKPYNVDLDISTTGEVFKYQLYSLTGVEPERQKILIKGGQLKDDTDLSTLNIKPGHTFMMMGTPASNAVKAPIQKPVFLEDMSDEQLAKSKGAIPSGLQNLGNTCYMNATLQTLRFVPELQDHLEKYDSGTGGLEAAASLYRSMGLAFPANNDLTAGLKDLYNQMSSTTESFAPVIFLQILRTAFPQFAQKTREGRYQQQDAEECWSQIIVQLRQKLKIKNSDEEGDISFMDKYFAGKMKTVVKCNEETPDEPPVETDASFLKLDCHIGLKTNFLKDGIRDGLTEEIEKESPSLGRNAVYTKTSKVIRLPKYLTCHFVRFYWKREIQKKTKIMRKVNFPFELDATEFCSDNLRAKLIPIRDKIRDLRKDAFDRERAKKRMKTQKYAEPSTSEQNTPEAQDAEKQRKLAESEAPDWEKELAPVFDQELLKDEGANVTGLYELMGVITHQGAGADSGHYCSYVKKEGGDGKTWWFFNDDKVSEVSEDKIEQLSGGGESHSALICLYKAISLAPPESSEDQATRK